MDQKRNRRSSRYSLRDLPTICLEEEADGEDSDELGRVSAQRITRSRTHRVTKKSEGVKTEHVEKKVYMQDRQVAIGVPGWCLEGVAATVGGLGFEREGRGRTGVWLKKRGTRGETAGGGHVLKLTIPDRE